MMELIKLADDLTQELSRLRFGPPVRHVYNPLVYARKPYLLYLKRYAAPPKEVVLLGMNPGPWGMAQTGIPFGEIKLVKNWLNIQAPVGSPPDPHPLKPVTGFDCPRSEVSGKRLWGWIQETFKKPESFFKRFFVANYCPLLFLDAKGRNLTPDKLKAVERKRLLEICDRALRRSMTWLKPRYVVGIGNFALKRAQTALAGRELVIGGITHPSPANPKANRGWKRCIVEELNAMGIEIQAAAGGQHTSYHDGV